MKHLEPSKNCRNLRNITNICYLFDCGASSAYHILVELLKDRNFHTEISSNLFSSKQSNQLEVNSLCTTFWNWKFYPVSVRGKDLMNSKVHVQSVPIKNFKDGKGTGCEMPKVHVRFKCKLTLLQVTRIQLGLVSWAIQVFESLLQAKISNNELVTWLSCLPRQKLQTFESHRNGN